MREQNRTRRGTAFESLSTDQPGSGGLAKLVKAVRFTGGEFLVREAPGRPQQGAQGQECGSLAGLEAPAASSKPAQGGGGDGRQL